MHLIETLQVRPYRVSDRAAAIEAFSHLTLPEQEEGLKGFALLEDRTLKNDLCIILRWQPRTMYAGKSPLGLQLAAGFSRFGSIYHVVWSDTLVTPPDQIPEEHIPLSKSQRHQEEG